MPPIEISVTGLTKRFGKVVALDHVTFDTGPSWQCLGVVGRNAAGKTTLLRHLVGLLEQDGGTIRFACNGQSRGFADPRDAFFIAEIPFLPESFTGLEFLRYLSALNDSLGVENDVALREEILERLLLKDQVAKRIGSMSKGTKRKLEVVAALSSRVPLVVADELSEGLDIPTMREIQSILKTAAARGQRFLISSHDVAFLTGIADKVVVIDHSRCADFFDVAEVGPEASQARIFAAFESNGGGAGA